MSQPVDNVTSQETPVTTEGQETAPTETPTDTDLTPDQLKAELKKVRAEAADRRIKLRDAEAKAKLWNEHEESQKSELQKLQDRLAEKDKALADKDLDVQRAKIAREFNVADEDLDLLVGDEENMKRLAQRLGTQAPSGNGNSPDLYAGNRGKPVGGASNTFSMEDFIRGSVQPSNK